MVIRTKEETLEQLKIAISQGIRTPKEFHQAGLASLYRSAVKYFGWSNALKSVNSEPIRKKWSKKDILQEMKDLQFKNVPLNYSHIKKIKNDLVNAAQRVFGSWEKSLAQLGISKPSRPKQSTPRIIFVKKNGKKFFKLPILPSKKEIIDWILLRHIHKKSLIKTKIQETKIYKYYKIYFTSWNDALIAAGIKPIKEITNRKPWNKEIITNEIKLRHKNNLPINSFFVPHNLNQAAQRHFDGWDNALLDSGFILDEVKLSNFWTKEVVIKRIKERKANKQSLYVIDVNKESLFIYGKKFFGSWKKAVEAAGFEYKYKPTSYFGERILEKILKDFFPQNSFDRHKKFNWLKSSKNYPLHFDFYCEYLKLAFELQGPTHFIATWGEYKLIKQQENDKTKRDLAKINGITLIEIKYDKLFPPLVSDKLIQHSISHVFSNSALSLCAKYSDIYKNKFKFKNEFLE